MIGIYTSLGASHGEGSGNPLQYSCLENPRGGRAWWAGVYGVAQSRTRLKQLSSSSSMIENTFTIRKVLLLLHLLPQHTCSAILFIAELAYNNA